MRYAHIQQNNFVAAQVLRLSDDNYIMARAYVQPNGSLGAYSQERGNERWEGRTYATEDKARKPMFSIKKKLSKIPVNATEVSKVPEGAVLQNEDDTGVLYVHEGRHYLYLKEDGRVKAIFTDKEFRSLMRSLGVQ